MGALAEAFAREAAKQKDAAFGQWVCEVIAQALSPFKPGVVTLELEYNADNPFRTLSITAELLPRYSFRYKFDDWAMAQAYYPDDYLMQSVAKPLFDHFRYRPSLPVDDHIVLGEE